MTSDDPGEAPVTDTDRAEELAAEAGVDPTPEQIQEYQRLEGDPVADALAAETPDPQEPPD
jgi:hypothetical protein